MTVAIALKADIIHRLDLSPVRAAIGPLLEAGRIAHGEQQFTFNIDYPRDATDPRELSEIPEIRLWFVRLDSAYPWLPFLLDWKAGELGRYTAMLVPHQFHPREGIHYNPEALEIFVMEKVFVLADWLKQQEIPYRSRLKAMAQVLGYELAEDFLDALLPP